MKQFSILALFFLFFSFSTFAQRSIQAMVFDSKNELPLEMGNVRLLKSPDSTFVQGSLTDSKGSFNLSKVKSGNYILIVSMVGYKDFSQNLVMDNKDLILKNIQLIENSRLLGEVEVKGNAAQMVVKGDTMEYNATAFKTVQNAVVEDLLKRMPGVQVSADGKITVNGQSITKIRVDGKKFFDGDIETATKNMPADMIDKVQVLDQKSDVALLTGFEDNNTERIINLTTKANRKKGVFGNINGGAGLDINNDVRYDGNGIVSMMNGDTQTAILGGGNNTNTSRSGRSRGGLGGPGGGLTQTQNFGVNNNTTLSPKLKIGGDASFNHSTNESITENNTTSYLSGSTFTNHSFNNSTPENYNANLRLEAEWKPDSLTTIVLQPNMGYNRSFSNSSNSYSILTGNDTTTIGNSTNTGNSTSINGGLNIIYNRKFTSKKGRTLTANFQSGLSQNNSESLNISNKTTANVSTPINQYTKNISDQYNFNLNVSFVEPLWNLKNLLQTTLSARLSNNTSEKDQYNKDPFTNNYTLKDSTYSNNFENNFYTESFELNYKHVEELWNVTLGGKIEPSQTINNTVYGDGSLRNAPTLSVINFSPTARLQYNFTKKTFLRADYTGRTSQPSIDQMQPVKNNSNQMNETVGNPDLNPSFSHNLRVMYSAFNDKTFSSFNTFFNVQATKDALVLNSIYDQTGKQYSQTVNSSNIPFNINGMIMFNTPIIAKTLHFMTSTSYGLNQRYGYSSRNMNSQTINTNQLILGDLSNTNQYSAGESLSLTLTEDAFEIGAKGSFNYSNTLNNLNPGAQITKSWTATGNVLFRLPYSINIGSDLNYSTLQGFSVSDQKFLIWNATIDKTIFKSKKGVIAFKINDILHQQLNFRQTIGDNSIVYSKFNTLPSYFILSFSYKIADFGGARNQNGPGRDMQRFGPGRDGGGGDYHPGGGGHDGPPRF
jgi:hypothetical protein